MNVTAVVLAAGTSSRMGTQKLLLRVGGTPMIDRVLSACENFPTILVASAELAARCHGEPVEPRPSPSRLSIIINTNPELGMAHSLALADAAAPPEDALLVFLADKPFVSAELAETICAQADQSAADVCFPQRDGVGGHPVFFSAYARARIAGITGDSLQALRDDPSLRRVAVPVSDPGAYTDIDGPEALERVNAE